MQNHLLQVLIFLTMEQPESMNAKHLAAKKVELLQAMEVIQLEDVNIGQFTGATIRKTVNGEVQETYEAGYKEDEGVPPDSKCPTYAQVCLKVNNDRWQGVPMLFTAGKGLDERMAEVRVRFKPKVNPIMGTHEQNELVMRIQPHESIYLKIVTKQPGLETVLKTTAMSMNYSGAFVNASARDAYERMLLFGARGDNSLFVGSDELVEAWRVFTPMLHAIDAGGKEPMQYPFGTAHPPGSMDFAAKYGIQLVPSWQEYMATNAVNQERLQCIFEQLAECSAEDQQCTMGMDAVERAVRLFYDGVDPTPERIQKVMDTLDMNQDKRVSWEEFQTAARSFTSEWDIDLDQLDHTSSG